MLIHESLAWEGLPVGEPLLARAAAALHDVLLQFEHAGQQIAFRHGTGAEPHEILCVAIGRPGRRPIGRRRAFRGERRPIDAPLRPYPATPLSPRHPPVPHPPPRAPPHPPNTNNPPLV